MSVVGAIKTKKKPIPLLDPMKLIQTCWPGVTLYKEQREIVYSVDDVPETIVPAGNQLGKDFVAALICLVFFLRRSPCRIVTTSVDSHQLEKVLWGEMKQFINTSKYPLPLDVKFLDIRKVHTSGPNRGREVDKSYLIGRVAKEPEGLLGHHLPRGPNGQPRTLVVYDEGSGIGDEMYKVTESWRHRALIIGNCFPCANFFYKGSKRGNIKDSDGDWFRKVIRIKAENSPNVKLAHAEIKADKKPSHRELIPGVVSFRDYQNRRMLWDEMQQSIGLDAEFYEGIEVKLYPMPHIEAAETIAKRHLRSKMGKTLGIDPAMGGDNTSFAVSDQDEEEGWLCYLESLKTPDTMLIVDKAIILMNEWGIIDSNVLIDAGGGGVQIANNLRRKGFPNVRVVNFGSAVKPQKIAGTAPVRKREHAEEKKFVYRNKRAQMYDLLSLKMNPSSGMIQYGIPTRYLDKPNPGKSTLREQMEPIPRMIDDKGVIFMLPKQRKTRVVGQTEERQVTLTELIGHSPDELDSVVLSVLGLEEKKTKLAGSF